MTRRAFSILTIIPARMYAVLALVVIVALMAVLAGSGAGPADAQVAPTLVVDSAGDSGDGDCTLEECTLREAINAANANAGTDSIEFDIPGPGVKTITPTSDLPTIRTPVTIDGYTQPDSFPNTLEAGNDANLLIELNGANRLNAGLRIQAANSTVRGLVINRFVTGIDIRCDLGCAGATNNTIEGNYIGTDASGTAALRNVFSGITLGPGDVSNTTVGGTTPGARNVISGNNQYGVIIWDGATENEVRGNYIGTAANGTDNLGNTGFGVLISGSFGRTNATVGGAEAGAGNLIAFNREDGVAVTGDDSKGTSVLSNSIHSNGELGIDLGNNDGVTPNDPLDADTGPNNLQNYPTLASASGSPSGTTVTGTLHSTPETTFDIQFFASPEADASGFGEGKNFLGQEEVTTSATGTVAFTFTTPDAPEGRFVTATATNPDGETSEFSNAVPVAAATDVPTTACTITGTRGDDRLMGTAGEDVICGFEGNDIIKGLPGDDTIKGGEGNDNLFGGAGDDSLDGKVGRDTAYFLSSKAAIVASLATGTATGSGTDTLIGVENLVGSKFGDDLAGSAASNRLVGGEGADELRGGSSKDTLVGQDGADTLHGQGDNDTLDSRDSVKGNDSLDGGAGTDACLKDAMERSVVSCER